MAEHVFFELDGIYSPSVYFLWRLIVPGLNGEKGGSFEVCLCNPQIIQEK
jgi:hypothetical protein